MTNEEHRLRHAELHQSLDELIADFLAQTDALPNSTTLMELMNWSYGQTVRPTENRYRGDAAHLPVIEVNRG